MRNRGIRYAIAFVGFVIALSLAAGSTFWLMRPVAKPAGEAALPLESGDAFVVRNTALIRPSLETYARYDSADARWRAQALASWEALAAADRRGPPVPWQPSDQQVVDDSVFVLSSGGRLAEAAGVLERWLAVHPLDASRRLALARLYVRLQRTDDALAQYATALQTAPADRAARREYAAALLWAQRYAPAADQYARLVASDSGDRDALLGLGRALAWGGRPAEAEPILARLWREQPGDTSVRGLLRIARANIDPSAAQAATWAQEDPGFRPYRLYLARALSRETRHAEAILAYDALLADSASVGLLTEAAGVRAAGGDSIGTARLLARAVSMAPDDDSLRVRYAQALAWSGDRAGAIGEYTRMLARGDNAALLLARGNLYLISGKEELALADLERSAAMQPSYEALASIGDLYRWRGDTRRAQSAYARALALRPDDARVLAALDDLRVMERALLASASMPSEAGWTSTSSYAEDNAGFLYLSTRLGRGVSVGRATTVSGSVEQRRISQRSALERERYITGYAIAAGAQHVVGPTLVSLNGGLARHALVGDIAYGALAVSTVVRKARVSARIATGPAYTELWSIRTLLWITPDQEVKSRPMAARSASGSVAIPIGNAVLDLTAEQLRLEDGNRRTSVNLAARQPIASGLRAVYSGGVLGFREAGGAYWDPERYTTHSAGVEFVRPVGALQVSVRALPGVSRSAERLTLAPGVRPDAPQWSRQFSGGADVALRRPTWEAAVSGGYGYGARGGGGQAGYQSLNGTLRVRATW